MNLIRNHSRKKVSYFYDTQIIGYHFGETHPMKPFRIALAHELIMNYGLYKNMKIYAPYKATAEDMTKFHSPEYINFLKSINLSTIDFLTDEMKTLTEKYNIGTKENDCPLFDGCYSFSQISAGGSLSAASSLIFQDADIAINWAGGLHHAKKSEASGFCYVNDITLCILELLKVYSRVLYVDIDLHHGDGVEEAFFTTDRVMTVSFHRYGGGFFPGTGNFDEIGVERGKNYSINVPLSSGITDEDYEMIFSPIMKKVIEVYDPSAIVLQCGADSLAGDRLGDFNLTIRGHGKCVKLMKSFNKPLILLGGGGYTIKNVSRCWCYETAIALDTDISNDLPDNQFSRYLRPVKKLYFKPNRMLNQNTRKSLETCIQQVHETLRNIEFVPSVQIVDTPSLLTPPTSPDVINISSDDSSDLSVQIIADNEFYDDF